MWGEGGFMKNSKIIRRKRRRMGSVREREREE
jgi:hypothetical protein